MLPIKPYQTRLKAAAALLVGALLPLAFSPFHIYGFSVLCPALLLALLLGASPKQAFWRAFLFGMGFLGIGISWVYISLHVYGQADGWIAGLLTALMIMVLSLYIAVPFYFFAKFFPKPLASQSLLVFPTLWVITEGLRTWLLTGFPWLLLGNTQLYSPLAGLAPIIGVYGVSWVTAFVSALLLLCWRQRQKFSQVLGCILILVVVGVTSAQLKKIQWTKPAGATVQVSLVQGNIPQTLKWQPTQAQASLDLYQKLTLALPNQRIIVWPEAAITFWPDQITDFLAKFNRMLKDKHSTVLTGIPYMQKDQAYNALLAIGNGQGVYLKRHLVPFGEFIPFRGLLVWLKDYVQIPMSDFASGPKHQPPIIANHIPIASFICYEIAYPWLVAQTAKQSQLLVTISDDSWFGKSLASAQHVEIAQMRALETGRYLLMSTNDALTAIINPQGHVSSFAPPYETYVLNGTIQPMQGNTPWMRIGIYPLLLFTFIVLCWGWWRQKMT
ncbi:MAG: apolipoprotein N-acyltransferase [Gammaproteobacteria bacterium]